MRKPYLLALLLSSFCGHTQTTLVAGDIAFTGYNCDDNTVNSTTLNDDFCFILLKNITANTVIFFTDFGWRSDANAFQTQNPCGAGTGATTDGILRWTSTASMAYGTQIRISCKDNISASAGTVTGIQTDAGGVFYLSLATGGDQIFAYQGAFGSPTLIAGVSANGPWDATVTNCQFSSGVSILPAALSTNNYAVAITPEVDNARLKTSVHITGNAATDRAAIHNSSNWDFDDLNAFQLPPSITFLPVTFTSIRLGNNLLQWDVASEENVKQYIVQYSVDATKFSNLAVVLATGSPTYASPALSPGYYRVFSVDYDGRTNFSQVVKFTATGVPITVNGSIKDGLLSLYTAGIPTGNYRATLVTGNGSVIKHFNLRFSSSAGAYQFSLLPSLQKGLYILQLSGNRFQFSQKIIAN